VNAEFLDIQKKIDEELDKRRKKVMKGVEGKFIIFMCSKNAFLIFTLI